MEHPTPPISSFLATPLLPPVIASLVALMLPLPTPLDPALPLTQKSMIEYLNPPHKLNIYLLFWRPSSRWLHYYHWGCNPCWLSCCQSSWLLIDRWPHCTWCNIMTPSVWFRTLDLAPQPLLLWDSIRAYFTFLRSFYSDLSSCTPYSLEPPSET